LTRFVINKFFSFGHIRRFFTLIFLYPETPERQMAKAKKKTQEPIEKQLWKAADKLRKNIDASAGYAEIGDRNCFETG